MEVPRALQRLLLSLSSLLLLVQAACPDGYSVRVTNNIVTLEGDNEYAFETAPNLVFFVGQTYTFTAYDTSLQSTSFLFTDANGDNVCTSYGQCNTTGTYPLEGAQSSSFTFTVSEQMKNWTMYYGGSGLAGNSIQVLDGTTTGRYAALGFGLAIILWMVVCAALAYRLTDTARYTDEVVNWLKEVGKDTKRPAMIFAWLTIIYDSFQFITFAFIEGVPWYRATSSASEIMMSMGLNLDTSAFFIEFWVLVGLYVVALLFMGCAELFLKLHVRFYPTGSAQLAVHQKRIMITYVYMELILLSLLFVTTMRTMLNMLSCDYVNGLDGCTVQTEIACWQGIHWFYASVAVAMVLVILPLCYGHYLTKNEKYDPAVKYIPRFQVYNITMKFCVCIVVAQAKIVPYAFITILLVSRLIALAINFYTQPCLTWSAVNNFNTAAHATEAWFAIMALITLGVNNSNSYSTLIAACVIAPFVFMLFYMINSKQQAEQLGTYNVTMGALGEIMAAPFSKRKSKPQSTSSLELFSFKK